MKPHLEYIFLKVCLAMFFFLSAFSPAAQINTLDGADSFLKTTTPGDSVAKLHLRKFIISGNNKTRDYIILREVNLKPGDSVMVSELMELLEKDRQHIYNTTLFVEVVVEPLLINAFEFDVIITVKERWYIFPLPELQFVDATLNEWLIKYKGDLTRLNYGMKFTHYNLTGRKDQLKVHLLNGYTKTISLYYKMPYVNDALTDGFSIGGGFFQNREVGYKTGFDNEIIYYKQKYFVKSTWEVQLGYSIRRGLKITHSINLNYTHTRIEDSVISGGYNSAYFNKAVSKIGYVDFYYTLQYIDVNNVLYPLTGSTFRIDIGKGGLGFAGGINQFSITAEYNRYISLGKKWYVGAQVQGNLKLPFNQAYINQRAMGYGNSYVRGYDYKIIDGVAYAISKFNFKKEIFNFSVNTIFKKSKTLNKIPFRIYAKTFADIGYCYNKEDFITRLNNKFLGSTGIGFDIVTFYDLQIRLEYSVNQLGQKGLFLHNDKGF